MGSAVGIDATFPYGAVVRTPSDPSRPAPAHKSICGPALAEHGHEFFEVADVPG